MDDRRALLLHLLATIAFRARYALRGAPESFGSFQAGNEVWTPGELVRHMASVLGYARSCFEGESGLASTRCRIWPRRSRGSTPCSRTWRGTSGRVPSSRA